MYDYFVCEVNTAKRTNWVFYIFVVTVEKSTTNIDLVIFISPICLFLLHTYRTNISKTLTWILYSHKALYVQT